MPNVAKVVNNFPSHGNNLGMPVVSMTSRALVKKIVQEKGAEPRLYLFDGERFTDALDGAEDGSRLAVDATRTAMQIMGGFGYSTDSKVEMLYRDAKATEIYEGANEVVLNTLFKLAEKYEV